MNEQEQELATAIYDAIQRLSTEDERSVQAANFRIGPSDLGHCSEKVRRMVAGIPEESPGDKLEAFLGSAIGEYVERAIAKHLWPHALVQADVLAHVRSDEREYEIVGHPDVIVDNKVLDVKTTAGLDYPEKHGPKQQQQWQRHVYALGAWQWGLLEADSLSEVEVGNVWIDRSGKQKHAHVDLQPFDEDVIRQVGWWLDEVVDAYLRGEEAEKEPHYNFCEGWCGHFADCRMGQGDVEGLITDPEVIHAVDLLQEAKAMESEAKRMKNTAQIALKDVEGIAGDYSVKWTLVGGGDVAYKREPYKRLDVRRVKKK